MVYITVGTAVVAACHYIEHTVVLTILERSVDRHMMTVCHEALSNLLLVEFSGLAEFCNRRMSLVFLLEFVYLMVYLVERTYLVERKSYDAALLSNSLEDALSDPPYSV